jgi:hypothetical protein
MVGYGESERPRFEGLGCTWKVFQIPYPNLHILVRICGRIVVIHLILLPDK